MSNAEVATNSFLMPDGEAILIRQLQKADLPALEWDGEYTHFRRLYANYYANSQNGSILLWVAENAQHLIIGQVFVLLYSTSTETADGVHRAYAFSFRLKPEYRDQGLGSFMLHFLEEDLLQRGFSVVRLNVARTNSRARNMYEKHGYRVIGPDSGVWRYQDHIGQWRTIREPAWRMLKQLR